MLIIYIKTWIVIMIYDYIEFAELSLLNLGEGNDEPVTLIQPGVLHKARWMSKLLYNIPYQNVST